MESKLSADDMVRKAEGLYLDAAFMLTKLDAKMRKAVRLVILDNVAPADAARQVRRPRQNVYRALLRVRPKLAAVKAHQTEAT